MKVVFRRLSLSGWNYYRHMLMYIVPISRSDYYKIKSENKIEAIECKACLEELRSK